MMQVGKPVGMVTLNDALLDLVTRTLVAPEDALAKAVDKAGLESSLKRTPALTPRVRDLPSGPSRVCRQGDDNVVEVKAAGADPVGAGR